MAAKHVLLLEGQDDEHVVKHICTCLSVGHIEEIHKCGGYVALLESIPVRLKQSDIVSLGIILDADADLAARWQAVIARLRDAGYAGTPAVPDETGTVLPGTEAALLPKVGIWLMPNNQATGQLEDFLQFLVSPGDNLIGHATAAVNGLPAPRRFKNSDQTKALLHTWLAWQAEPGRPFGLAISHRYFDPTLNVGPVFADWLRRVFF